MRLCLLFVALIALLWPGGTQAQTIRGVFVGVDTYLYSSTTRPEAKFKDLKGAVNDATSFKKALSDLKFFSFADEAIIENCTARGGPATNSGNNVSITLINECATRAAIEAALNDMVDRSKADDTLLFYFAGHGSQYRDTRRLGQSSGYNGTILPTDARKPGSVAAGDIFDFELKAIKDRALAKGIRFVTIFDSCNSGSATRDGSIGETRNVPPLETAPPDRPALTVPSGPGGGYWVHLAAAQDGEQAQEVGGVGERKSGVFTTELIATLSRMPKGTFGDIIKSVQAGVRKRGATTQNPKAEGKLTAALGAEAGTAVTFKATATAGQLRLAAGSLSGMTKGSLFALFASEEAALKKDAVPLATARIAATEPFASTLQIERQPTAALSGEYVAIESQHAFGELQLAVGNLVSTPTDRQLVQNALGKLPFVAKTGTPQVQIRLDPNKAGNAQLLSSDGNVVGALGEIASPKFVDRLREKLIKVLRVKQLLAFTDANGADAIRFCIEATEQSSGTCRSSPDGAQKVLKKGEKSTITVTNLASDKRYLYVFGIDPNFGVASIIPVPGGDDSPSAQNWPLRNSGDPVVANMAGTYLFVTLATNEQINAAALEQQGTNARSGRSCKTALEQLLCDVNQGVHNPNAVRAGDWAAIVEPVIFE